MKTRPILFSGQMVKAILEGRKTQTRRVCKPRYDDKKPCQHYESVAYDVGPSMERHCEHGSESTPCPYGVVGDRLWVRETWAIEKHLDQFAASAIRPCDNFRKVPSVLYRADTQEKLNKWGKWRPSIFMMPWASRITLEVTGVRVERLREISMADVLAEGCILSTSKTEPLDYQNMWDSINAKRGFGWDVNPWVWVVEFKRVEK